MRKRIRVIIKVYMREWEKATKSIIKERQLPGVEMMATVVHYDPYISVSEAYIAILKGIDANDYQIYRPAREVYLKPTFNGSRTDFQIVTKIQFPIEKT